MSTSDQRRYLIARHNAGEITHQQYYDGIRALNEQAKREWEAEQQQKAKAEVEALRPAAQQQREIKDSRPASMPSAKPTVQTRQVIAVAQHTQVSMERKNQLMAMTPLGQAAAQAREEATMIETARSSARAYAERRNRLERK